MTYGGVIARRRFTLLRCVAAAALAVTPLLLITSLARGDNMPPSNPPPAGGTSGSPGADASGSNGPDAGGTNDPCCSGSPAPASESPPPLIIDNSPAPAAVDNAPAPAAAPSYVAPAPQTGSAGASAPAVGTDLAPDFKPPDAVVSPGKTPQVDIEPQPIAGAATSGGTGSGSSGGRSLPVRVIAGVAVAVSGMFMMFGTMFTDVGKAMSRWGRGEPEPPAPTSATGAVKG